MGTSTSHPGGLVPPWADRPDPVPAPPELPDIIDDQDGPVEEPSLAPADPAAPGGDIDGDLLDALLNALGPARFSTRTFRGAIRKFAETGEGSYLQKAVRHYARAHRRKASSAAPSRSLQAISGIFELFEQVSRGEAPGEPSFQLASLEGMPLDQAAIALIQALSTSDEGFEDQLTETAMADAMSRAMGNGVFSVASITPETVCALVCEFVKELVFKYLWLEMRPVVQKLPDAPTRQRVETDVFEVVKSVVERTCDGSSCAPLLERKTKVEIAKIVEGLASEAAGYLEDFQCA